MTSGKILHLSYRLEKNTDISTDITIYRPIFKTVIVEHVSHVRRDNQVLEILVHISYV